MLISEVLILIVVDNGLVLETTIISASVRTVLILIVVDNGLVLHLVLPCASLHVEVLILIVVDNGLVPEKMLNGKEYGVLILIVVDNGLVLSYDVHNSCYISSLNPYCSGQWSRT